MEGVCEVECSYDPASAADAAFGLAEAHSEAHLVKAGNGLRFCANRLGMRISLRHVRSHTGDPFNELVDCVAKRAVSLMVCVAGLVLGSCQMLCVMVVLHDYGGRLMTG